LGKGMTFHLGFNGESLWLLKTSVFVSGLLAGASCLYHKATF
jgi:hypothetical protein